MTVPGREPWRSAAETLLDEHDISVEWRTTGMRGWSYVHVNRIHSPEPRSAKSFAVFAHEVGHQVLHRAGVGGSRPQWQQEVEAWDFALEQFRRFHLPGRNKIIAWATPRIRYAFTKATRRGADARTIHRTFPKWSKRVQNFEASR